MLYYSLLIGFNYDLWHFFLLFQFPSALDSDAKSKNQPKTNPAPQTYPAFSDEKTATKSNKKKRNKGCPKRKAG